MDLKKYFSMQCDLMHFNEKQTMRQKLKERKSPWWMQKRCKQTLRIQSLFQTLCHEIPQKATRHMRSNTKRTFKERDQNKAFIPFYIKQSWREDISNNEQCNLCSYSEKIGRKDTLVKDLGKKSQFSYTLKLARLVHWQLAPTGATCTLTTSANGQLARVSNWQQAPTPENEKKKKISQPRPDSPLQAESPRLKWTM